jgi:hypothetical protein
MALRDAWLARFILCKRSAAKLGLLESSHVLKTLHLPKGRFFFKAGNF